MCVELMPELIDWSAIFIAFYEDIGGRGKVRTCDPCRVKAVLSTGYNVKSTTYAHRSRVYVTGMDWSGHI